MRTEWKAAPLCEHTRPLDSGSGYYHMYTFDLAQDVDLSALAAEEFSLVLVRLNISAYQTAPLDADALRRLSDILSCARACHKKLILRAVYDTEGHGLEREPTAPGLIYRHMEQLGAAIQPFADLILVWQGALIGSWGEMHSSRYLLPPALIALMKKMRDCLPAAVPMAVRLPAQWRMLHPEHSMPDETSRIGLFNDALFSSDSELGTFGVNSGVWQAKWPRDEELAFEALISAWTPFGGEALSGQLDAAGETEIISALASRNLSYLNGEWDPVLLNKWRQMLITGIDGWQGSTLYDFIGAHLGARPYICACSVDAHPFRKNASVRLTLHNAGFATLPAGFQLELVCKRNEKTILRFDLGKTGPLPHGQEKEFEVVVPILPAGATLFAEANINGLRTPLANDGPVHGQALLGAMMKR